MRVLFFPRLIVGILAYIEVRHIAMGSNIVSQYTIFIASIKHNSDVILNEEEIIQNLQY